MTMQYLDGMTDINKLHAVYRLTEEARLAHNIQGAIAEVDWKSYSRKWGRYSKEFMRLYEPLLAERARLRSSIRKAVYSDEDWGKLTEEEREAAYNSLYGDVSQAKQTPTLTVSSQLDIIKSLDIKDL